MISKTYASNSFGKLSLDRFDEENVLRKTR